MSIYQRHAFDQAKHGPFVFNTFAESMREAPFWCDQPLPMLVDAFKRALTDGQCWVATAVDDADAFLGWVACKPARNALVYAFTKYPMRRMGVWSSLCIDASLDFDKPLAVTFWTRAARRIRDEHGYGHLWSPVEGLCELAERRQKVRSA